MCDPAARSGPYHHRPWGGDSHLGGDGGDGDGQGGRFWAGGHSELDEASFSAPQAKKILGLNCHFTAIYECFEEADMVS